MDVKPYINPFEEGSGDKVEEPVTVRTSSAHQLDALRHQVMDAVASSDDKVTLVLCLDMLTHQRKHRRIRCAGKSDVFLFPWVFCTDVFCAVLFRTFSVSDVTSCAALLFCAVALYDSVLSVPAF